MAVFENLHISIYISCNSFEKTSIVILMLLKYVYVYIPVVISIQKRRGTGRFNPPLSFAETRNPSSLLSGVATCSVVMQRLKQNVKSRIKYKC